MIKGEKKRTPITRMRNEIRDRTTNLAKKKKKRIVKEYCEQLYGQVFRVTQTTKTIKKEIDNMNTSIIHT